MKRDFGLVHAVKSKASTLIKYPLVNALRGVPMPTVTGEQAQIEIARRINIPGSLIARIGATEGKTLRHYLTKRIAHSLPESYPVAIGEEMKKASGFFPINDATLDRFCQLYLSEIGNITIYAAWTAYDRLLCRNTGVGEVRVRLFDLDPFFTQNRWTMALAGKRVTIVNPFAETIEQQYARRKELFVVPTLPAFSLSTVKAPMTHVSTDVTGQDWFDNLEALSKDVARTDPEVVIVGAGAYGFPVAATAARQGAAAVVLGGATQLLFGIAGQRWLNDPQYRNIMTPAWTSPSREERPAGYRELEISGGAYW